MHFSKVLFNSQTEMKEVLAMVATDVSRIRIMRIIARMNLGGPAVQISWLIRGINILEFNQQLFTGRCDIHESDYLETVATDVTAIRINGLGRGVTLVGDLIAFIQLIKEIRKFKPHIIHTHTAKAGFLGRIASIISMHPSIRVHTYHGHLLFGYFGKIKKSIIVFSEKILAIVTNHLLAVGDNVMQDLLQAKIGRKEKFSVMPPGLELGDLPDKLKARENLKISSSLMYCSFIGRVTQIKRPDRFLDVVSEVSKRNINLHFLIAGDGQLLNSCRERINRENLPITILGWQSKVENVLSASDIVLLTSDNEGTPLSLIQAGMAGIPVVSTNVGSVSEIVRNGVTGILTSRDVKEIADALEVLVRDETLREQLGRAGRSHTVTNYSSKRLVNDHEKLYKKLLSNLTNS